MNRNRLSIRMAVPEDAESLLSIYAPYVQNTSVTFETEVPSTAEFAARIRMVTEKYPWLVCESESSIVGYAYASQHRQRAAYRWSADLSVYIAEHCHRKGIATALYGGVMRLLERQGYHTVFAGVTLPNPASVTFHLAMGFRQTGVFENDGFKLGEWHGVAWFQKPLGEYGNTPAPTLGINEISAGDILSRQENLLNRGQKNS